MCAPLVGIEGLLVSESELTEPPAQPPSTVNKHISHTVSRIIGGIIIHYVV